VNNFEELIERLAQRIADLVMGRMAELEPKGELEYVSPAEMSVHMGIKEATLANLRSRGSGPKFVKVGGAIRYPVDAGSVRRQQQPS
jgi:hypothetical protein